MFVAIPITVVIVVTKFFGHHRQVRFVFSCCNLYCNKRFVMKAEMSHFTILLTRYAPINVKLEGGGGDIGWGF